MTYARAETAGEISLRNTFPQWSRFYLSFPAATSVFKAQVSGTYTTTDRVASISFGSVTLGAYTDIKPGFTIWIGTSAGLNDVTTLRVRSAASSGAIPVGEVSGVTFVAGQHITVFDEVPILARQMMQLQDMTLKADYDLAYSAQHTTYNPVGVLGPTVAIKWLTGATVAHTFDATQSWSLSAGTITYSWATSGGTLTNATTSAPTLTCSAAGTYRLTCTLTQNGVTSTCYRWVVVLDATHMPTQDFSISGLTGSWNDGGWSFDVTMHASTAGIHDRALVVLHAANYFGGSASALGPLAGYENIIAIGWIANDSIDYDYTKGTVSFSVRGANYWLNQVPSIPTDYVSVSASSSVNAWSKFAPITARKVSFDLLYWRSTFCMVADFYCHADARGMPTYALSMGALGSQINGVNEKIFAKIATDRYSRLFVDYDPQITDATIRASMPTLRTITSADCVGSIKITRRTQTRTARVSLVSTQHLGGLTANALYSLAPGHSPLRFGELKNYSAIAATQANANSLAALLLARDNYGYDFEFTLAQSDFFLDIAPLSYIHITVNAADNLRGMAYAGRAVVREVTYQIGENGNVLIDVRAESEAVSGAGINGDIPPDPGSTTGGITIPGIPPIVIPPGIPIDSGGGTKSPKIPVMLLMDYVLGGGIYYCPDSSLDEEEILWWPFTVGLSSGYVPRMIAQARSGLCWAMDDKNIYRASYPGAAWMTIENAATLTAKYGSDSPGNIWHTLGINKDGTECAVVSIGSAGWFWRSEGGRFTATYSPGAIREFSSSISFGDGKWRFTGAGFFTTPNGELCYIFPPDLSGPSSSAAVSRVDGHGLHWTAENNIFYGANTGTSIYKYDSAIGASPSATLTLPVALAEYRNQPAVSPDGSAIIFSVSSAVPDVYDLWGSLDGGTSWGKLATLPGYGPVRALAALSRTTWIIATVGWAGLYESQIRMTTDAGATWKNITGNLNLTTYSKYWIPINLIAYDVEQPA